VLEIEGLDKSFGGLKAVAEVGFSVHKGEIVGLIGPNGAGKTTVMNLISGVLRPDKGSIRFKGREISGLPSNKVCHMGICRTYQIPKPFYAMTALASVTVSVLNGGPRPNMSLFDAAFEASHYLEFVGLFAKRDTLAKDLNLYELRMLELARALGSTPELLLLDEAMAGLNPGEASRALEMIWSAQEQFGITILWIEHVMKVIMAAAQRIVVLQHGQKLMEGTPREVVADERVIKAYLGGRHADN
jgi:branched-chain amino acid transport system ATP-binding protein